ncbi:uncharacterized protein OCT59_020586 [Rhizophagus irregularis]|uniref:uncharacterized protein n=1 Tax=Rhizophagus irregularis TaxID=588596 RepID=UPI003316B9C4|nr:hypothetical protein OCT59_020586 [Rhizophagus irregularis]
MLPNLCKHIFEDQRKKEKKNARSPAGLKAKRSNINKKILLLDNYNWELLRGNKMITQIDKYSTLCH